LAKIALNFAVYNLSTEAVDKSVGENSSSALDQGESTFSPLCLKTDQTIQMIDLIKLIF
jgi:hypothetical protein